VFFNEPHRFAIGLYAKFKQTKTIAPIMPAMPSAEILVPNLFRVAGLVDVLAGDGGLETECDLLPVGLHQ
jgi:hypothetical protein